MLDISTFSCFLDLDMHAACFSVNNLCVVCAVSHCKVVVELKNTLSIGLMQLPLVITGVLIVFLGSSVVPCVDAGDCNEGKF